MEATELGHKAIRHPKIRAGLLDIAILQHCIRKVKRDDVAEALRYWLAGYLAATPSKRGFGFQPGDYGDDDFIKENFAELDAVVQEAIDGAIETYRAGGGV